MATQPDTRPRTVVLLQFSGIGDLIWHIVYFKAIAAQSQGGRITVVAQPSTLVKAFLGQAPWVEHIIEHDHRPRRTEKRRGRHAGLAGMWRMATELRQGKYDQIVLFSGRISRGLVAALSGIPDRRGYGYRWLQRIFLNKGPFIQAHPGPSVAAYPEASAFAMAHGFVDQWLRPTLDVPEDQMMAMRERLKDLPRPLYALAIGTSETHKQWGEANYARLTEALIQDGAGVVILGGPAEREIAKNIQSQVDPSCHQQLAVITDASVYSSAAILKLADACVGNDTGMVNVAAAVDTRTYVLMGSRPALDHDPAHMTMVNAPSLRELPVAQVVALLRGSTD